LSTIHKHHWFRFSLFLLLGSAFISASSQAQEIIAEVPAATASSGESSSAIVDSSVTAGVLESRIKEVEASSDLDEAVKTRLTELYRKALSNLESIRSYDAKAAVYAQSLKTAPSETQQLREAIKKIQETAGEEPLLLPESVPVRDIEQQLAKEQADAVAVEAKLNEMEKELDSWSRRPAEARQRITDARTALEELSLEMSRPAPEGEQATVTQARKWGAETSQRALRAEILMLDRELLSHGAREDLLRAASDKAVLDLKGIQVRTRSLENQLNERRRAEAEQARNEARTATRAAADKHPLVGDLAEENAMLTEELTASTNALDRIDDELTEVQSRGQRLADEYRSTRQRMEISRLSQALGQVLLDRRQQLPDQATFRKAARKREVIIADTNLRQIRLNEEQLRLRDMVGYIDELLASVPPEEIHAELRAEMLQQLEHRKELLTQTQAAEDAYLRELGELDYASGELLATVTAYEYLLDEHLLWVRSGPPVSLSTLTGIPRAVAWLLSPSNWAEVGHVLLYEAKSSPMLWLLTLTASLLLWRARSIRQRILALADHLRRVRTDRFGYTLQALALTALLALPWPLLFAALGWQLEDSLEATPFTKAVGIAAISVSFGLFSLRFFSLLCIANGVADRHFRWTGGVIRIIRRNFAWAVWLLTPTAFIVALLFNYRDLTYSGTLGRVALIVLMIGLTVFTARLTHPKHGVLQNLILAHPDGWLSRLRHLWYPLVLALPLALIGLILAGYTYTAGTLLSSLIGELWLVLGLAVLHQSIVRWLIVTRRRLALQAALERRATRVTEAQTAEGKSATAAPNIHDEVNLASLDEQTRRLINAGIFVAAVIGVWAIWSDMLPAFARFEDITLWHYTGMVNGEEQVMSFTLASIFLILVIIVLATVAARNLPALLEILLLQRISVSAGSRYTVKTMTGYLIAAGATMMVFSTLGLSWGQVQWLVAALGVGIGFGLQEIVANFISGIIILFEHPVRVGDVVTIGETTGTVTKIRIRATTIRNWDKQELLVPNKEFITGRLLNWTLSDTINRIFINVGVDYGNDVRLAMRLLEEAVREEERVLDEPEPVFGFEGFGDNALNLTVRCYLGAMEYRIAVTTALHHAINDKFQAHGISIAYPQRDVHLSAAQPLDVRVLHT